MLSKAAVVCMLSALALLILTACRTDPARQTHAAVVEQPVEVTPVVQQPVAPPPPVIAVVPETEKVVRLPPPEVVVATPLTPAPARPKSLVAPDYRWREVPTDRPNIALTFDDGPNPRNTPALLDILKQRGIRATFFVLGQNAAAYPRILERMIAEGHEIANHGWNHASLPGLTADERAEQVRKTNEAIERASGQAPRLIRPPYGATTPSMNRWLADELKMSVVLWSVDSRDWQHRDPNLIKQEILSATKPGAVILAHDIHRTTVSAMPGTLDALLAKGYNFVTVSDLITSGHGNDPTPSRVAR